MAHIYSGSDDKTVRKIDSTGEQVWSFTGHTKSVRAVAVDADGYVYSSSYDKTVRKIDSTGEQVWSFTGHTDDVGAVAVDADGYVYSVSNDKTVRKIDSTGEQVWSFTGHTSYVRAVAVDADGYVYSGSYDDTVRKIDSTGEQVWSFTGHTSDVYAVAVDADGYVYSGSSDKTVRKIDSTGEQVWSFTGHTKSVYAVAVDADGYVYSGSSDNTVRKIDPTGEQVWSFTGHTSSVYAVAVDADGYVYSSSYDDTVRKIDPTGEQVWSFTGHTDVVGAVAVDPGLYGAGFWTTPLFQYITEVLQLAALTDYLSLKVRNTTASIKIVETINKWATKQRLVKELSNLKNKKISIRNLTQFIWSKTNLKTLITSVRSYIFSIYNLSKTLITAGYLQGLSIAVKSKLQTVSSKIIGFLGKVATLRAVNSVIPYLTFKRSWFFITRNSTAQTETTSRQRNRTRHSQQLANTYHKALPLLAKLKILKSKLKVNSLQSAALGVIFNIRESLKNIEHSWITVNQWVTRLWGSKKNIVLKAKQKDSLLEGRVKK